MSNTGSINNIFSLIKVQYGASILAKVRRLERLRIKFGKYSNHLRFSLRCLHSDLLPNDLRLKCKVHTQRAKNIIQRASKQLLQERIRLNHNKRVNLKKEIEQGDAALKNILSQEHYDNVKLIHDSTQTREMNTSKERQLNKFNRLVSRKDNQTRTGDIVDKDRWIINLSDKQLSESQKSLLEKGMKFSITENKIPKDEIISKVESSLKGIEKVEADTIRAKVSLTLQQAKAPKDNLSAYERRALKELKNDDSIIILPADKGRATVILNKEDYYRKCDDHINNGPYEHVKKDPTKKIKEECRVILSGLEKDKVIDRKLYWKLKPTDSPAPRFYGLPKIHKPGVPIRPIVSYTGTPLYNVSKYIADILKTYIEKEGRHSENSKVFSEYVRTLTVEEDEVLVSFDVTSLYTNVPIKDTLLIIKGLLENDADLQAKTKIPSKDILNITEFLLTRTWYKYKEKYFQQTDGVAMGGPTSSVVAEIYMQNHDKVALSTFVIPLKVYERFVDDTFSILKRNQLQPFHDHLNSIHPKIQFTVEEESEKKLPFLDTLLRRNDDGTISVLVYRKPTHTDQYLNFKSNHTSQSKDAVISALFRRAKDIVSDKKELERENERIVEVLRANDYSTESIMRVKRKVERSNRSQVSTSTEEDTEPKRFIGLPYIPGTSEALRRVFTSHKIKCAFYSKETLRKQLSKPKDKVPLDDRNNIVYKIPCSDCNASYIGETKRSFSVRKKEHESNVRNGHTETSKVAKHCWSNDHRMNLDEMKVIDSEPYTWSRKVKETIHSIREGENRYFNDISYHLPAIWIPNIEKDS